VDVFLEDELEVGFGCIFLLFREWYSVIILQLADDSFVGFVIVSIYIRREDVEEEFVLFWIWGVCEWEIAL
jgi:hypothetical protein